MYRLCIKEYLGLTFVVDLISLIYAVNENNEFQFNSSTNISASIVYKKFYLICILVSSISNTDFEINQKILKI